MSRIGKQPVVIPQGVKVEKNGRVIKVQGPKGTLEKVFPEEVEVTVEADRIVVKPVDGKGNAGPAFGLARSLLQNMVKGVSEGIERVLEINGVGYRVAVQGRKLNFSLGYSHPIEFELPEGMSAEVERQTILKLKGVDKEQVGSVAARIRGLRKPEPYKGKGIKYAEERIVRKAGKAGK